MARAFTAASSHYLVGTNPVSAFPFSMACRFRTNDITHAYWVLELTDASAEYTRLCIGIRGDETGDHLAYLIGKSTWIYVTGSVVAGTWHQALAISAAQNNHAIVLDGDWAGRGTGTASYNPFADIDRVSVGAARDSTPGAYLDGAEAEVAFWSVALGQADSDMLADGASPLLVRPDALAAYWPLIGRTSPEVDLVGSYPLTVSGAVAAAHPRVLRPASPFISFAPYVAPTPPSGRRRSWATIIGG